MQNLTIIVKIIPRARVGYEMVIDNEARRAELATIISHPKARLKKRQKTRNP